MSTTKNLRPGDTVMVRFDGSYTRPGELTIYRAVRANTQAEIKPVVVEYAFPANVKGQKAMTTIKFVGFSRELRFPSNAEWIMP